MKLRKHHGIFLSLILSVSLLGGTLLAASIKEDVYTPTFATYTNGDAETYYNSLDLTKTGNDFLKDLRSLNLSKRKSTVGYSSMGTDPSGQYKYTDYDSNTVKYDSNGQPYGTKISSFYTYTSATGWNREHVWPNSHGGGSKGDAGSPYPDADIHMPRPTISSENSSRGNSFFVEGMNHSSNGWDPYTAGYSAESRGEAARITFYCTLVNSKLILAPNNTTPSGTDPITGQSYGSGHTMGNLETLIKWTINHPVTQRERNRNEGAEYLQGNRNPFVDHPEFACRIWGNANSTVKNLCDNASWDVGNSVSISATSTTVAVDEVFHLSASVSSGTSQITWTSSDSTVVEVDTATTDSGAQANFTAVGPGTATITASATIEGNPYTATCLVTVSSSGGGGGDTPTEGDYTLVNTDFDSSYPSSAKSYTSASGLSFTAYQVMNQSGSIQFKNGQGYLYNNNPINLGTISINNISIGSLKVYAGTSANPTSNEITASDGIYDLSGYTYFRIACPSGSYSKCDSIQISLAAATKTLESISFSTVKTSYTVGDTFVKPIVTAYFNDDSVADVTSQATFTGYDMSTAGTQTVQVSYTYEGITQYDTFEITVSEPRALSSISLSGQTTSYWVGDTFSFDGTVTAHYDDGSEETVSANVSAYPDMTTAGNKNVTISYTENNVTKQASYQITVSALVLDYIDISSEPSKTSYYVGDTFSSSGLEVTAYYTNNSHKVVTPTSITSPNMSTAGNKTVTVTYTEGGVSKTDTFTITVNAVELVSISVAGYTNKFNIGDTFSFGGTVTATYNNDQQVDVTNQATFTGYDMNQVGTYSVIVSYGNKNTTYQIKVVDPSQEEPVIDIDVDGDFVLYDGELTEGNYVIVYNSNAMKNTVNSNRLSYEAVTINNGKIESPDESLIWHIEPNGDYWTIYNESVGQYAAGNGTKNQATLISSVTNYAKWEVEGSSTYDFINFGNASGNINAYLRLNGTIGFACYASGLSGSGPVSLYRAQEGGTREVEVTRIEASYSAEEVHPGETFDANNVSVKAYYELDNVEYSVSLDKDLYTVSGDGYMFTYEDSTIGSKSFNVTFATLSDAVSLNVTRVAYVTPSSSSFALSSSTVFSSIGGGNSDLKDGKVTYQNIEYNYYQSYYYKKGSSISFGNASNQTGYVENETIFPSGITNITVTSTGRNINIKYSVDGINWVLKENADVDNNDYRYMRLDCVGITGSDYSNIKSISITLKDQDTVINVSNYIMYEDIVNQCVTKLDIALNKLNSMSSSDKNTFMTSNDYVIKCARERIQAWARNQDKEFELNNNNFVINSNNIFNGDNFTDEGTTSLIVIICALSLVSTISLLIIKKRKHSK